MQSLCTLTTFSDTFCTAVNKKRKHNGASGAGAGDEGQKEWGRGQFGGKKCWKGERYEREKRKEGLNFSLGKEKSLNI